jgi:succinoglycan biosynthesis protein ExoM
MQVEAKSCLFDKAERGLPTIGVCVCTYKRPELLNRLVTKLEEQETDSLFDYSITIVDNDRFGSARRTVESLARASRISVGYYVEPEQNIARARNKAVHEAKGDFVAFIDDDEFPNERWLVTLYQAMHRYASDGVLGPVLPHFETRPPNWVLKGRFFDRPTHRSGHVLDWKNTRTGNALMRRELFKEGQDWFDPAYGSGGEDRDYFRRRIQEGHIFVWCNEAPVFETVPPGRWKRTILIKRALLRGKMALNGTRLQPVSILKSAIAIAVYSCCLPLFFVLGHHIFMKYLIKTCDHAGKVLAYIGIDLVREKYVAA